MMGRSRKQFCPRRHDTFICGRSEYSQCRLCVPITQAKHRKKHHKRLKKYFRKWFRNHPDSVFKSRIKNSYGITSDTYEELVRKQKGKCAICQIRCKLQVDHNHTTKQVRGLLCRFCNSGLGHFRDSIKFLTYAIKYLHSKD